MRRLLTVAGSDSSGGAGIQQDLAVFATFAAWGLSAVTSVTAQTTRGVESRRDLDPDIVVAQIRAAAEDGVDAAKTGMLATASIVEAVAGELAGLALPLVVDPVIAASSGHPLLDDDAIGLMRSKLFPLADVVTPNAPEAEILTGVSVTDEAGQRAAARALLELGPRSVIVTGGHLAGDEVVDILAHAGGVIEVRAPRIPGGFRHGTGCVYSAALTAALAAGEPLESAAGKAQAMVARFVERGRVSS